MDVLGARKVRGPAQMTVESAAPGHLPVRYRLAGTNQPRPGEPRASLERGESCVVYRWEGIVAVEYSIPLRRARAVPYPAADPDAVHDLVTGMPIAYGAFLLGGVPLHGAAFSLDDRVVVLAAPSMTGKSTLLAACIARGARFVADDLAHIVSEPDWSVSPGHHAFRLTRAALDAARLPHPPVLRRANARGKDVLDARDWAESRRLPLAAVVVLERGSRPGVFPLGAARAVSLLSANLYGFSALTDEEKAAALSRLAALSAAVPVVRLVAAAGLDALEENADRTLALASGAVVA
jgi:hypothetical protein